VITAFRFASPLVLALVLWPAARAPARGAVVGHGYYAAPTGSPVGTGSPTRPWDLATALSGARGRVQPGDTIWLRGGTYKGSFRTTVAGRTGAPVVIRQYPGERAVIDGARSRKDTWVAAGEYTTYWGFELTNSNPDRSTSSLTNDARPDVIANYAPHTKYINLIVHDGGVALYTDARFADVEIAGCIFYNNGWDAPDRGHGHAMYLKNYTGPVLARDNVAFNQYGYGIHAYTNASSGKLINITIEGNVAFNNGSLASRRRSPNILLGGDGYAAGGTIRENMTYVSPKLGDAEANVVVGWKLLRNGDVVVERNYFAGGSPVLQFAYWTAARVSNDTLIGGGRGGPLVVRREPSAPGQIWRDNIELDRPPRATRVFVRPNPYEAGRAHVVVYNWGRKSEVTADMSGVLVAGDRYEVRNVQDLFGPPVVTGTLSGTSITIPMSGVTPPAPTGLAASSAPKTAPEFDTFLVTRLATPGP
jgi:hypothetical protein